MDPDVPVHEAPAIWSPRATPFLVLLDSAPAGFNALTRREVERAVCFQAEVDAPDGHYVVAATTNARYRLWMPHGDADQPLAYLVIADEHADVRRALAAGFHEQLTAPERGEAPACLRPGPSERWRLVQWLRLLDALENGARGRDIAAALITADAADFSASEWDGARERKRIARWTQRALAMRDGGYRNLLLAT